MRAVEFGALGELCQQDRGRTHGDRPAEHDGGEPGDSQQVAEYGKHRRGGHHLQGAEAKHLAAHGQHARQREFEPQGEQQKRNADLADGARRLATRQNVEHLRPDQDADDQVAENDGQTQSARQRHEQHRDEQQDQQLAERL